MRTILNLNSGWLFHKGDIKIPRPFEKNPVYIQSKLVRKLVGPASYNYVDRPNEQLQQAGVSGSAEGWQSVNLPHDYVVLGDALPEYNGAHGYFKYENAWYRKHFRFEEDVRGKRITLQFGGIAGASTVYLNGCLLKHNFSSYNSFEIDITNNLYYDADNVIAVYTSTEDFEGWWYQGSGIYRDVKLVITEPVCIEQYGVFAPYKKINDTDWQINFETTVLNTTYEAASAEITSEVINKKGEVVAAVSARCDIPVRDKNTVKYSCVLNNPDLWDLENPNLYTVKTTLSHKGKTDEDVTRIGFREVMLDADKGLFLNQKHIKLKGVCMHQDFGLSGIALPNNVAKYKVSLMKQMGANGFRTAHYQHCDATMDALDEQGFIVMNEARWFETNDEAIEQLTTLVKRDRNRPSVVFWSTGNEEPTHITDMGERVHRALYEVIRKLDNTRFITTAEDRKPLESTVYKDCDLVAVNYHIGDHDSLHEMYPDKPIVASECCATGTSRDWHFGDTVGRATAWDKDTNVYFLGREKTWRHIAERDYMIGLYQWVAVDHRGEAVWPMLSSKSGSLDLFLQKKGGFYQNKSHWTDEPMVHILPHWNFKGLEGEPIKATVYTNCEEVELFLNGESLGKQRPEKYGRGEWDVEYTSGSLRAVGYNNGVAVSEQERTTTGDGERLELKMDLPCKADGSEIALFTCTVLDKNGLEVPTAEDFVEFFATNGAEVVATGSDSCDPRSISNKSRKMYMGKITVAVKPKKDEKSFELYAKSGKLGYKKLTVNLD